jgi:L-threonylcarbamoyladenylate synthase
MSRITRDPSVAVQVLRNGGLVAIPTETVYGLAADAENPTAVAHIFAVKGRPTDHPLIVHLADAAAVERGWADPFPESARALAESCWPGPLTLLVPRGRRVGDWITGGRPSVGLRVPAHPLTTAVLAEFGGGLAAPSANRFGRVSPTSAEHVAADLGDDVDLILDGGECPVGVESTIVDCCVSPVQILRPGAITPEQVRALLGAVATSSGPSRAAGMLASHYAPTCRVELFEHLDEAVARVAEIETDGRRASLFDASVEPVEVARTLYDRLRRADALGIELLVVALPPASGLGFAIRDRLSKAAAPRLG